MDKATSNHAFCSTDTPTSVSLSCAFVLFVVKYSLRPFVSIGVHWCPFVVHILSAISCLPSFRAFRVFRAFRGSSPPQWTRGRIAARARPRAPSTHCLLLSIPYEKLFVSIRVHSWFISFRHFVPFVYFVLFVVKYSLRPFVSIRVHSWFIRGSFVVHSWFIRGSYLSAPSWFIFSPSLRVHSWPRRTTAPSKNRPGIPERLSKRFTFLPATRRHRSRMGLPGRPR